jgi:hypothetical protein
MEVILYILKGARASPTGEVRESKHEMKPGANSTGPCGRPHGRQISQLETTHAHMTGPADVLEGNHMIASR